MDIQNKKILFLGDSITEGFGPQDIENVYWKRLERDCGCISVGYGISGTRIARQQIPSHDPREDQYFRSRVEAMEEGADVVVVFGGTNDYGHGDAPLGEMGDRTVWTYYGALHVLFTSLLEKYPRAAIVVLTPMHREDEEVRQPFLKSFVDATRQVAEYYSLPVLDLWANSGIQPRVPVMKTTYMPDGLHPSDAGHAHLANKLRIFLEQL